MVRHESNDGFVASHELGHNFGVIHAASDRGDDNKQDGEYSDISCTMGGSWRLVGFNAPHRLDLGWIHRSSQLVAGGSDDLDCSKLRDSITLQQLQSMPVSGKTSALRIRRADGGEYYFSYRTTQGFDGALDGRAQNRVHVHYKKNGNTGNTLQIAFFDADTICQPEGNDENGRWTGITCQSSANGFRGKATCGDFVVWLVSTNSQAAALRFDFTTK